MVLGRFDKRLIACVHRPLTVDSQRPVMSRAFLSLIRDLRHAKGVMLHTTRARSLSRTMREANRLRHSRFATLTEEERATLEKLIKSQTALQDS